MHPNDFAIRRSTSTIQPYAHSTTRAVVPGIPSNRGCSKNSFARCVSVQHYTPLATRPKELAVGNALRDHFQIADSSNSARDCQLWIPPLSLLLAAWSLYSTPPSRFPSLSRPRALFFSGTNTRSQRCASLRLRHTMLLRTSMMPRLPRAARACLMSSGRTRDFEVGQGGRLVIDMNRAAAVVKVTTKWIDSCNVIVSRLPADADVSNFERQGADPKSTQDATELTLLADEAQTQVNLSHDQDRTGDDWEGVYLIEAVVPELFSVDVLLSHGNVSVANKLKGDCQVQLGSGDISVGTVRGETIRLSTGCGRVKVDELEGNVDVTATADVSDLETLLCLRNGLLQSSI